MEITLSTGKKISTREKTGQFHLIEGRLLTSCAPNDGYNIVGTQVIAGEINIICSIAKIDGKEVKVPETLSDMYEIMAGFSYEEITELKLKLREKEAANIKEMAKKLQANLGSEAE